jgi:hypothetical protein
MASLDFSAQLVPFNRDGLELVINTGTGEAFASASAIARMVSTAERKVQAQEIKRYASAQFEGDTNLYSFDTQINTAGGLQGCTLFSEKAIREVAKKFNVDLLDKFADVGIRMFLHQLAGYKVQSTVIAQPVPQIKPYISYKEDIECLKFLGFEDDQNIKQLIRAKMEDELSLSLGKQAVSPKPIVEYTIGKVRATELGYSLKDIGSGSDLGKYLAKNVPIAYSKRIGNWEVNHYEVNDELDCGIHCYFENKKVRLLGFLN